MYDIATERMHIRIIDTTVSRSESIEINEKDMTQDESQPYQQKQKQRCYLELISSYGSDIGSSRRKVHNVMVVVAGNSHIIWSRGREGVVFGVCVGLHRCLALLSYFRGTRLHSFYLSIPMFSPWSASEVFKSQALYPLYLLFSSWTWSTSPWGLCPASLPNRRLDMLYNHP